jgi:hypothetical protein
MEFIVNNEWNSTANFYKLDLPYLVTVGDSIIAPESTEASLLQTAHVELVNRFDLTSNIIPRPPVKCIISMCPNQATITNSKIGTPIVHTLCNSCFEITCQLHNKMRDKYITIRGDHLFIHGAVMFLKKKYRWDDLDIPLMYINDTISAIVSSYYPMWVLIRELPLPLDITRYIMIYFALIR